MCQYSQQSNKVSSFCTDHVLLEIGEDGVSSWSRHKQDVRNHQFHPHSSFVDLYGFFVNAPVNKLIIAAQISASLCYLYRGPWLDNRWSRSNLVFFDNGERIPCQPYLRVSLSAEAFTDMEESSDNLHAYPQLLELGIMLLELEIGMSIEEYTGIPSPLPDINTKLAVATMAFQQRKAQIFLDDYRKAIQFCLKPDLEDIDDDSEAVRMAIFRHVFLVLGKIVLDSKKIKSLHELDRIPATYDIPKVASLISKHGQSNITRTNFEFAALRMQTASPITYEDFYEDFDLFASETEASGTLSA
jgi:hypothetical protein